MKNYHTWQRDQELAEARTIDPAKRTRWQAMIVAHAAATTKNILWLSNGNIRCQRDVPVEDLNRQLDGLIALGYAPWIESVPL